MILYHCGGRSEYNVTKPKRRFKVEGSCGRATPVGEPMVQSGLARKVVTTEWWWFWLHCALRFFRLILACHTDSFLELGFCKLFSVGGEIGRELFLSVWKGGFLDCQTNCSSLRVAKLAHSEDVPGAFCVSESLTTICCLFLLSTLPHSAPAKSFSTQEPRSRAWIHPLVLHTQSRRTRNWPWIQCPRRTPKKGRMTTSVD